jgi:hypothetical protein
MQLKHTLLKHGLIAAAFILAVTASRSAMAGDSVTCISKQGFVTNSLPDGTFCQVDTTNGKESIANASKRGQASADAFMLSHSTADATDGGIAEADSEFAKGKAKATASGDNSSATAIGSDCHSTATGDSGGQATANCSTGKAHASASDGGVADAESTDVPNCVVKASATGAGSSSTADCKVEGGFVTVATTGGGVATGDGFSTPTCIANSGTATVESSSGNCK